MTDEESTRHTRPRRRDQERPHADLFTHDSSDRYGRRSRHSDLASSSRAQTIGATPVIPDNATALEGLPTAWLDATSEGAKRQRLDRDHAAMQALQITIVDGRYYWTSRENRPLTLTTSGEFTYLMSTEPGQYIRFRKINDRLSYVEHVDMGFGSVT